MNLSITDRVDRPLDILALSAQTPAALTDVAHRVDQYVLEHPGIPLSLLCGAINGRGEPGPHRLALVAGSLQQLHAQLSAFAAGEKPRGRLTGQLAGAPRPRIALLCTGQGSQYPGMARELYATSPVFARALERSADALAPHLAEPLLSVLYRNPDEPTPLHDTAYTQPALFAIEYALAQLWRSWGIAADAVLGHSVGEYTAACLAGVFSLEDAVRLVALRGRLMQERPPNGSMAVVFADEARVSTAIEPYQDTVSLAAINGPGNTVISGLRETIDTLRAFFASQNITTHPLTVSHAFHSPLMEPMLQPFEQIASRVRYRSPSIPLVSNVTGTILPPGHVPDARYWRQHVRAGVRFADGVRALSDQDYGVFLEVGPDPVLIGMGKRCVSSTAAVWLASLEKARDNWSTMLTTLGTLYVHGAPIDWSGVVVGNPRGLRLPADLIEPVLS